MPLAMDSLPPVLAPCHIMFMPSRAPFSLPVFPSPPVLWSWPCSPDMGCPITDHVLLLWLWCNVFVGSFVAKLVQSAFPLEFSSQQTSFLLGFFLWLGVFFLPCQYSYYWDLPFNIYRPHRPTNTQSNDPPPLPAPFGCHFLMVKKRGSEKGKWGILVSHTKMFKMGFEC